MGQVGTSADNAPMENWFALLQKNVLNRRRWATRQDLRVAIVTGSSNLTGQAGSAW